MKTNYHLQIIISSILVLAYSQPNGFEKVTLQDQIMQNACESLQFGDQTYYGHDIFSNDDKTRHMVLSGWFLIRPYNLNQVYNLFIIKETLLNITITLQCNVNLSQMLLIQEQPSLFSKAIPYSVSFSKTWMYIYTDIQLNSVLNLETRINIMYGANILQQQHLSEPFSTSLSQAQFDIKSLIISIGSPQISQPSCAMIKRIEFYWLENPSYFFSPNLVERGDLSSGNTYLYQYFDFNYTTQNLGKLLSQGYNQTPLKLSHTRPDPQEMYPGETIITDFINFDQENGIVINFQAKISNPGINQMTTIFEIKNSVYPLTLSYIYGKIQFNGEDIFSVNLDIWNHFTITIKNQLKPRVRFYIRRHTDQLKIIQLPSKYVLGQLQFGHKSNEERLYVSNIRIYKGNYQTTLSDCEIGVMQIDSNCITCEDGYSLMYTSDMTCQSNDIDIIIQGQEIDDVVAMNLFRPLCNQGMINSLTYPFNCTCLKGFYLDIEENKCQKCPSYCIECFDSTSCNTIDKIREMNGGICLPTTFDDGYSCIDVSSQLQIKSRNNVVEHSYFSNISTRHTSTNCGSSESWQHQYMTVQDSQLENSGLINYFISFSFSITIDSNLNALIFFYEGGTSFELNIYIQCNSGAYQVLVMDGVVLQNLFTINQEEEVWIGIFLTINKVTTIINQHGTSYLKQFTKSVPHANYIQIGAQPNSGSSCVSLSLTKPFQLIKDIPNLSNLKLLNLLYRSDKQILAKFTVEKSDPYYSFQAQNIVTEQLSNIQLLSFPNSLLNFSFISGFTFSKEYFGIIDQFANDSKCALSFYFVLQVSEIHMQTPLISYKISDGFEVNIYLFPLYSYESISIRICFGEDCQDGSYSYITLNEINFIIISSQEVTPFSTDIYFQEFEIVTNYKREKLQFVGSQYAFGNKINNFKLGTPDDSLQSYNFTLTNFNIIEGDGFFYYEYDDTDPCFAFINLSDMQCLYLKTQYVYCDNTIRLESLCKNIMDSSIYHFYHNRYNQTYTQTAFLKSKCLTINFDENSNSIICTDKSSPYYECQSGEYNDAISQECLPCDSACEKCSYQSTNCSSCLFPEQKVLPNCSCQFSNQFLNQMFECQNCSKQCSECFESESKCTVCAPNRINPPFCNCEPAKYTSKESECVLINCHKRCETCTELSPENCTKCSINRENPPECLCMLGFEENSNGYCQKCKQSQYFDEQQKKCLSCSIGCNKCAGSICLECQNPLELVNNACTCTKQNQSQKTEINDQTNISIECLNNMEIKVNTLQQRSYYDLKITFSKDLLPIDFQKIPLENLLNIYFTVLPKTSYNLFNPQIIKNKLIISIKLEVSISKMYGYLIFADYQKFLSTSLTPEILDVKYTKSPIQFDIGPFFIQNDSLSSSLDDATQNILESQMMNSSVTNFLNNIQFFFYILNTLQPSSYFLQLKAIYPPHLYKFYQLIGKLIFPFVPDYQSSEIKEEFYLFSYKFEQNETSLISSNPYRQLGYSNSILVNVPLILLKYLIILTVIGIIQILPYLKIVRPKNPKITKLLTISQERLNIENEVNLLSVLLAILLQLQETNQSQWISRISFYLATIIFGYYVFYFYKNYMDIKTNKFKKMSDYYFTNRINLANSSQFCKYYFLMQYTKKYIVIILLFMLYNNPVILCILNTILFLASCISTVLLKPYKQYISLALKIFGELLFSILWLLHAIIIYYEKTIYKNFLIQEDDSKIYSTLGSVIMILLFIYNLIYFIEFISNLINKLYQIYQDKLKSKQKNKIDQKVQLKKEEDQQQNIELSQDEEYQFTNLFQN